MRVLFFDAKKEQVSFAAQRRKTRRKYPLVCFAIFELFCG
jgi:hypothetical protein